MIATMDDCFRPDLPIEVVRAQARVAKLVLERGLPPRLLTLCTYLVSTTSLKRSGRVYLSREKVAGMLNLSERTIDRHFKELESSGFLERQVRERTPDGWFYGTCVRWSAEIWDLLFVQPGRTRRDAIAEQRKNRQPAATEQSLAHPNVLAIPATSLQSVAGQQPANAVSPTEYPTPTPNLATNHATKVAHYSSSPITTVFKGSVLNNGGPKPTFEKNTFADKKQPGRSGFNIPPAIAPWATKLNLQPDNISLLMVTAKKTDPNRTKTRLQDLLNYVGERLLRSSILGASASKYLFKCLTSGEDYSQARFNAPDSPSRINADGVAATALRDHLPEGEIKVICGSHLIRDGYAVRKVDPVYGLNGPCALLTLEQQAVMARRGGLIESTDSTEFQAFNTVDLKTPTNPQPASQPQVAMSAKDIRRAEIRKEFLSMAPSDQALFAPAALTHLKAKGMAGATLCAKVEEGDWLSAPLLVSVMVEQFAVAQYGPQWAE